MRALRDSRYLLDGAMSKLSPAAIESLARIDAVGLGLWVPGDFAQARLADLSFSAVNVATVKKLLRYGLLEESGEDLVVSAAGKTELSLHPELRGRARQFYEREAGLAEIGFRSTQRKPEFRGRSETPAQ